jgi:hypothetical protein
MPFGNIRWARGEYSRACASKTPYREKTSTAITLPVHAVVPQTTHVAIPYLKVLRIVLERFGCPW